MVYFTRTPQKRGCGEGEGLLKGVGRGGIKEEEEGEEDEGGTPAQVFLRLVESSICFSSFLRPIFTSQASSATVVTRRRR